MLPHQQPSPVLPFSFCPSLPSGCSTPLFLPLPDLPVLCGLILQSGQPSRLCQRRHGAWLLHTDPGKLPAEFTLTRSLQCLVIRLVLRPVRAFRLLLPRIFLHSTPSPSCLGLILIPLTELGEGGSEQSGFTQSSQQNSLYSPCSLRTKHKKITEGGS